MTTKKKTDQNAAEPVDEIERERLLTIRAERYFASREGNVAQAFLTALANVQKERKAQAAEAERREQARSKAAADAEYGERMAADVRTWQFTLARLLNMWIGDQTGLSFPPKNGDALAVLDGVLAQTIGVAQAMRSAGDAGAEGLEQQARELRNTVRTATGDDTLFRVRALAATLRAVNPTPVVKEPAAEDIDPVEMARLTEGLEAVDDQEPHFTLRGKRIRALTIGELFLVGLYQQKKTQKEAAETAVLILESINGRIKQRLSVEVRQRELHECLLGKTITASSVSRAVKRYNLWAEAKKKPRIPTRGRSIPFDPDWIDMGQRTDGKRPPKRSPVQENQGGGAHS